jgi:serine/threonine protein phosphatase PrpC
MENRGVVNKKVGIFSCQNKRKCQEDRFYHGSVDGGEWYAVYDGHGADQYGDTISHFLQENLHDYFHQASGSIHERMMQAFKNADDNEYVQYYKKAGSTASVVYIKDTIAYFAHVGDSRALLEACGMVAFATEDHKPLRCDEKERIENAGGVISFGRVDGKLAVSRAIGDHRYDKKVVISEPEYTEIPLTQHHKFLVVASDGLWDTVSNEDVADILDRQQDKIQDMNELAKMLVDLAIERGSTDNITVMVVDLL